MYFLEWTLLDHWYQSTHIGQTTMKSWLRSIAIQNGIDLSNRKITTHSGRKTLIRNLKENVGATDIETMSISRHKSLKGLASYERSKDKLQANGMKQLINILNTQEGKIFNYFFI